MKPLPPGEGEGGDGGEGFMGVSPSGGGKKVALSPGICYISAMSLQATKAHENRQAIFKGSCSGSSHPLCRMAAIRRYAMQGLVRGLTIWSSCIAGKSVVVLTGEVT